MRTTLNLTHAFKGKLQNDRFQSLAHTRYKAYGRPKSRLIIALIGVISASSAAHAATSPATNHSLLGKFIIALAVAILVHAAIPAIKHFLSQRSIKKSYLAYLNASIDSTLVRYGKECSIDFATKHLLPHHKNSDWINALNKAGLGIPAIMLSLSNAFDKTEATLNDTQPYIPIVSYSGLAQTDLDHEHPVWSLPKRQTKVISIYLLSQQQILDSVKAQFEQPIINFINSDKLEDRKRWVNFGRKMLDELVEHYIATIELKRLLNRPS